MELGLSLGCDRYANKGKGKGPSKVGIDVLCRYKARSYSSFTSVSDQISH